jgi:hypothetical protein
VTCIAGTLIWFSDAETKRSAILVKDFYKTIEVLEGLDPEEFLSSSDGCDTLVTFSAGDGDSLGGQIPKGSIGFCIRFCEGTDFKINGISPPQSLIGVYGLEFGQRTLSIKKTDLSIIAYDPTNGTNSEGDAVKGIWQGTPPPGLYAWFPASRRTEYGAEANP